MDAQPAQKPTNQPTRHHVLPKCHQQGFTLPSSPTQLYAIDAKRGTDYTTNIINLIVESDFYKAPNGTGDPHLAEKLLGTIETDAAPVIQRIDETLSLPTDEAERCHLLYFLANLWARARHFRSTIDNFVGDVSKKMLWATVSKKEIWDATVAKMRADGIDVPTDDYEGMKAFIESDQYDIHTDRGWLIGMMFESTNSLFRLLMRRHWVLYATPGLETGPWFVTADEPVQVRWIKPRGGLWPPGFGLRDTVVTVPLTRRCYLEGYFLPDLEHPPQSVIYLDPTHVAHCNIRTIELANEVVLAPDRNFVWMDETGQTKRAPDLLAHVHRRRAEKQDTEHGAADPGKT